MTRNCLVTGAGRCIGRTIAQRSFQLCARSAAISGQGITVDGGAVQSGPSNGSTPQNWPRPAGFAHAVVASNCRLVFLAGQTALDGDGKIFGDGVVAQFH